MVAGSVSLQRDEGGKENFIIYASIRLSKIKRQKSIPQHEIVTDFTMVALLRHHFAVRKIVLNTDYQTHLVKKDEDDQPLS